MAYASVPEVTLASEAELANIATLRVKLEPELKGLKDAGKDFDHTTGDIFFTRLLRGNNGSIEDSVVWYRTYVELRAKYGLDEIHMECEKGGKSWKMTDMPHHEEMAKYINTNFDEGGLRSSSGHLVWYDALGDSRTAAMLENMSQVKILKFMHTMFERRTSAVDKLSRAEGRIVKILRIMDVEGTGFWQFSRQWQAFEKEFVNPVLLGTSIETVHVVFVNNFPRVLQSVWEVIKIFIPPRLLARFRFFGTEYLQDKDYLQEVGLTLNNQLVATNRSHSTESATGDASNYEGENRQIPGGCVMERILEVKAGQTVTYDFEIGKGDEAESTGGYGGGFFSKMVTKFSGSEVFFNVSALWTDVNPQDIEKVPAKVRSAGADSGNAAEFWVDGKQIEYEAADGVSIIAVDLKTKGVISKKTYDVSKAEANEALVSDIAALPPNTMVLFAVKGSGAEELSKDAWDALDGCGAVLKEGHWHKGYAMIGTNNGTSVAEARGDDVVAEGAVPTMSSDAVLEGVRQISIESGPQKGAVKVARDGMVVLAWSNAHAYMANKALAKFKIAVE